MINSVKMPKIDTGYKLDHSMITLTIVMDEFEHRKCLWKHNNYLLTDM